MLEWTTISNRRRECESNRSETLKGMKKIIFLFLLAIIPFTSEAQFLSVGGQYAQKSDGQFFTSFSYPVYKKRNALNSFIASGVDYTTYGGAKLS